MGNNISQVSGDENKIINFNEIDEKNIINSDNESDLHNKSSI